MDKFTPILMSDEVFSEMEAQRAKNRAVVEAFLAIEGAAAYEERLKLLADDVMYEVVFTMNMLPERICGKNKVRERYEKNAKCWEDFACRNSKIHTSSQTDTFLVECDFCGTITSPMFAEPDRVREYCNYGFLMFVLREGKIWQLRLFDNPMKLKHDFWKRMPNYNC